MVQVSIFQVSLCNHFSKISAVPLTSGRSKRKS